jgi:2,3-bisphosphoglycerate-independent phosphoglycerate mutase
LAVAKTKTGSAKKAVDTEGGLKSILLVVFDGLGDRPCGEFGGKTPLEAANTPNLDKLASCGTCGLLSTAGVGIRPGSDVAHLSLFGYNPEKDYPGRGPIEALGVGFGAKTGDVALRANFGTINDKGIIIDRRAGRIENTAELAKAISGREFRGVRVFVTPSVGHRAVVVLRGDGLSAAICDGDPHKEGVAPVPVAPTQRSSEAQKTADVLNEFSEFANKVLKKHDINKAREKEKKLPANFVLVRGAGMHKEVAGFENKYSLKASCVAGGGLYKGLARLVGMKVINVPGATGTPETNVVAKVGAAVSALETNDFVFLHLKGTDVMGEDGNAKGKKAYLEKADKALAPLLKLPGAIVAVTGDHSTPCSLKKHSGDPVPILFNGKGIRTDASPAKKFGERQCSQGSVGRIFGKDLMPELLNLAGRAPLVGD